MTHKENMVYADREGLSNASPKSTLIFAFNV